MKKNGFVPFGHLFLLALYLFVFTSINGQITDRPEAFFSIKDQNKMVLFLDDFKDNSQQWVLSGDNHRAWIADGDMTLTAESSKILVQWKDIALPDNADVEIELNMRNVGRSRDCMAGLSFGVDSDSRRFVFWAAPSGKYQISREDGNRRYDYQPLRTTKTLKRLSYNSLVMRRFDGKWYFFINQELVSMIEGREFYGNGIGLAVKGPMRVDVNYLKVSLLAPKDKQGPDITIFSPKITSNNLIQLERSVLDLRGKIEDPAGVASFKVNGRTTTLSADGNFSVAGRLKEGKTFVLNMEAVDLLGNRSTRRIEALKIPKPKPEPIVQATPAPKVAVKPAKPAWGTLQPNKGNTHLLLIGVNKYKTWSSLNNAVKDCEDIARVLTNEYEFDDSKVTKIYNEQATRSNILKELGRLQGELSPSDNLVIYYAGHGHYDEGSKLGYWVPTDARHLDDKGDYEFPDYIPNSTIHDYLRAIKTKHTLLLADACYAGSLFASYRGNLDMDSPSRWAFTSGNIERVWGGQPGQNSPFAAALISVLNRNRNQELRTDELISAVKGRIERAGGMQHPRGNPLSIAGDEGGVFVFKRRK